MDYEKFEEELKTSLNEEGFQRDRALELLAEAVTPIAHALAMQIMAGKLSWVREELLCWKKTPTSERSETFRGLIDRILPD